MTNLDFLFTVYLAGIIIHIISFIIVGLFIVPLQIKEARVKNGLAILRKQLLAYGILLVIVGIISTIILTIRFFIEGDSAKSIIVLLVLFQSLGFLGFAGLGRSIYTHQYTDLNKSIHEEIDKIEQKQKVETIE